MHSISTIPNASASDLRAFNRVRLFLGVTLLAEITSADGVHLTQEAWQGNRTKHTPLLWPYQPRPGPASFRIWRRLLTRTFLQSKNPRAHTTNKALQLRTSLGCWLDGSTWLQSKWRSFYCYATHQLYQQSDLEPHTFYPHTRRNNSRTRRAHFHIAPSDDRAPLPATAIPVDATVVGRYTYIFITSK
jgi:hypothetical protein